MIDDDEDCCCFCARPLSFSFASVTSKTENVVQMVLSAKKTIQKSSTCPRFLEQAVQGHTNQKIRVEKSSTLEL